MGNSSSNENPQPYAVPLDGTATADSTAIFRSPDSKDKLWTTFAHTNVKNCWDLFQMGLEKSREGPCLGTRRINEDGTAGEYTWRSYNEVAAMARSLGSAILNLELIPTCTFPEEKKYKEFRFLGVFSKNREEWLICEQAANAYGFTLVPLYDTLGAEASVHILKQTRMACIGASKECALSLLEMLGGLEEEREQIFLKSIVCFDDLSEDITALAEKNHIKIFNFQSIIILGSGKLQPLTNVSSDDINTICYTSGSTGVPKGVLLTHGNFVACVASALHRPFKDPAVHLGHEDILFSFLPMAHVFERIADNVLYACGARVGFYQGDLQKLMDDMQTLQPTILVMVPRLLNRIDDKVTQGVAKKGAIAKTLFTAGLDAKLKNIENSANPSSCFWDALVFSKLRAMTGGQARLIVSGSAPLDPSVHVRIESYFSLPILEGYGLTETVGGAFAQSSWDFSGGNVGGPVHSLEFRLDAVPEMGYVPLPTKPSAQNPNLYPIGELSLRGPSISPGYFANPEAQAEMFSDDGWLHTGDVCVLLPNGGVKIVDRKKHLFKLSQGEYVSPERIENAYLQVSLLAQIFVHGDSNKSCLVALVVPDMDTGAAWAKNNNLGDKVNAKVLCKSEDFKKAVLKEMEENEKKTNLKGFEKVKVIKLITNPFTVDNDLLTPTLKVKRAKVKTLYEKDLDALYEGLN